MAFRQYGGLNYASSSNMVSSNYTNTGYLTVGNQSCIPQIYPPGVVVNVFNGPTGGGGGYSVAGSVGST